MNVSTFSHERLSKQKRNGVCIYSDTRNTQDKNLCHCEDSLHEYYFAAQAHCFQRRYMKPTRIVCRNDVLKSADKSTLFEWKHVKDNTSESCNNNNTPIVSHQQPDWFHNSLVSQQYYCRLHHRHQITTVREGIHPDLNQINTDGADFCIAMQRGEKQRPVRGRKCVEDGSDKEGNPFPHRKPPPASKGSTPSVPNPVGTSLLTRLTLYAGGLHRRAHAAKVKALVGCGQRCNQSEPPVMNWEKIWESANQITLTIQRGSCSRVSRNREKHK